MMLVYIGWIYLFCVGFLTVLMFLDGAFNFKWINTRGINSEDVIFLYIVMYLLAPIFCILLILGDD